MLAEGAGLLQEEPGVHAVPVKLVGTRQHPQPLRGGKQVGDVSPEGRSNLSLPQKGGRCPPGGDTLALASEGRLSPREQSKWEALAGVAPTRLCHRPHRSRPGSCRTAPGTRRSYLSRRPGSAAPCRDGTAASSGLTAAAECAASGPAGEAEHKVRPRPHRLGAKSREQGVGSSHLGIPLRHVLPRLPLRLHDHPRAEEQGDEQDGVPELLEVLL